MKHQYKILVQQINDIQEIFNITTVDDDCIVIGNHSHYFHELPENMKMAFKKYDVILPYKRDVDNLHMFICLNFTYSEIKKLFKLLQTYEHKLPCDISDFTKIKYITPHHDVFAMKQCDFIKYREFLIDLFERMNKLDIAYNDTLITIITSLYFVNTFKKILRLEVIYE